jgi:hypothetical protein
LTVFFAFWAEMKAVIGSPESVVENGAILIHIFLVLLVENAWSQARQTKGASKEQERHWRVPG